MDPYLERPGLWEEAHTGLIVALQQHLGPLVRPQYRVAVERRVPLADVYEAARKAFDANAVARK